MNDKPVILIGLVLFLAIATSPSWYTFGAAALFAADPSPPDLARPEGALAFATPWTVDAPQPVDLREPFAAHGLEPLSSAATVTEDPAGGMWRIDDGARRYLAILDYQRGTLNVYDGCVEDVETMRAEHMMLLLDWREGVVRRGDTSTVEVNGRPYAKSLTGTCLGCHTDREAFCNRCHDYVNTLPAWPARNIATGQQGIRCWNCHLQPREEANDG